MTNKPFPTECLRKWAGAWQREQRSLIRCATDLRLRDVEPIRLLDFYSLDRARCAACENRSSNRVRNLSAEHDGTYHHPTILGILRGVDNGLRAFAFRSTPLAAGAI